MKDYYTSAPTRNVYITLAEAGKRFPIPLSPKSVLHRMKVGLRGVQLKCQTDGYRYVTTQEWIDEFIREITIKRVPQVVRVQPSQSHEQVMAHLRALKHGKRCRRD